jgi:hypothetical protein
MEYEMVCCVIPIINGATGIVKDKKSGNNTRIVFNRPYMKNSCRDSARNKERDTI